MSEHAPTDPDVFPAHCSACGLAITQLEGPTADWYHLEGERSVYSCPASKLDPSDLDAIESKWQPILAPQYQRDQERLIAYARTLEAKVAKLEAERDNLRPTFNPQVGQNWRVHHVSLGSRPVAFKIRKVEENVVFGDALDERFLGRSYGVRLDVLASHGRRIP